MKSRKEKVKIQRTKFFKIVPDNRNYQEIKWNLIQSRTEEERVQ